MRCGRAAAVVAAACAAVVLAGCCCAAASAACAPACAVPPVRALLALPGAARAFPYYAAAGRALGDGDAARNVTVVVVVVHGAARDATDYFCYMENAVRAYFAAGNGTDSAVLVLAPAVRIPEDAPAEDELYWDDNDGWKEGDVSSADLPGTRVSSFAVLDAMVLALGDRAVYPNLRAIVVAGHSAGGQVVQRYALGTTEHDALVARGIEVRYVPANPSSFCYLDGERPVLPARDCAVYCTNDSIAEREFTFVTPDAASSCNGDYNQYRYGVENMNAYMSQRSVEETLAEYPKRQVTYVQGLADNCNGDFGCDCDDAGMGVNCESMLQGYCRLWRGYGFWRHLQRFYGRRGVPGPVHDIVVAEGVAHDGCAIFQAPEVMDAMFGGLGSRGQHGVVAG